MRLFEQSSRFGLMARHKVQSAQPRRGIRRRQGSKGSSLLQGFREGLNGFVETTPVNQYFDIGLDPDIGLGEILAAKNIFRRVKIALGYVSLGLLSDVLSFIRRNGERVIEHFARGVEIALSAKTATEVGQYFGIAGIEDRRFFHELDGLIQFALPPFHEPRVKDNVAVVWRTFPRFLKFHQRTIEILPAEIIKQTKRAVSLT